MVTTNVSQIHLIQEGTKARTIVHIGSAVHQADREFMLDRKGQPAVKVRVSQVNAQTYGAPILIEILNNTTDALVVDGHPADIVDGNQRALLKHNDVLSIGGVRYRCELLMGVKLPHPALQAAWFTATGRLDHNEDAIGVYETQWGNLFVIADGVGGAEAGEMVSEFAVNRILAAFHDHQRNHNDENWLDVLNAAYQEINREVRHFAAISAAQAGCTLTTVILNGWDVYVAHVGDSRLYLWNGIHLRQMTTDHVTTVIGENEQTGGVTQRVTLLKAIGKSDEIDPDRFMFRLQPDDRLMLCTDGVYKRVEEGDIAKQFLDGGVLSFPERLIQEANANFSDDNMSVMAIRLFADPQRRAQREPPPEPMPRVQYGYHGRQKRLKAVEEINTHPTVSLRDRLYILSIKARRQRYLRWWIAAALVIVVVIVAVLLLSPLIINGVQRVSVKNDLPLMSVATAAPRSRPINTPIRPLTPVPTVTLTPSGILLTHIPAPTAEPPLLSTLTPPPDGNVAYRRSGNTKTTDVHL